MAQPSSILGSRSQIMHKSLPRLCALFVLLAGWTLASQLAGELLVPGPVTVFHHLTALSVLPDFWETLLITAWRLALGLGLATGAALILGLAAGASQHILRFSSPFISTIQSCPPVVWLTLLMVWAGTGTIIPVGVLFAALFPPLFITVTQGRLSLDRRLLAMARVYAVPKHRQLAQLIIPGTFPHLVSGLSHALTAGWKAVAVAEFLGAGTGIGAKMFWAYRMLDMEELFAWTLVLIFLGACVELGPVSQLRSWAQKYTSRTRDQHND